MTNKEKDVWGDKDAEYSSIIVHSIKRLHPKICVVTTGKRYNTVEVTLALKPEGYQRLLKLASNPNLPTMLPLIFAVDKKGYVLGWITYRKWNEQSEAQK